MKKQTNLPAVGRKLTLNKKTISNLTSSEMSLAIGAGYSVTCHGCGLGGNSKNCTQNQNTCPGHNTCYNC